MSPDRRGRRRRRSGVRRGQAELVATELGTNLIRHADPGGYVLYRQVADGIELLSVDRGPGMNPADIPPPTMTLDDALSLPPFRAGGLTAGLAGVQRMATDFDCHSTARGTVILARLGAARPATAERWRCGGVNIPLGGTGESGDGWAVAADGGVLTGLVVDGLGHGERAAAAAHTAVAVFEQRSVTDLDAFIRRAHDAMRATRGGVLGVCVIDSDQGALTYAGVGNITGQVLYSGKSHHLLSHPGTLGTQLPPPRIHVLQFRWEPGATVVLATDGIRTNWTSDTDPDLFHHDPAVIAATLHRDHGRPTDDATVLIIQDVT